MFDKIIMAQRRSAVADINAHIATQLKIQAGPTKCFVLGMFQGQDSDWAGPVALIELEDGQVAEVLATCIKFTFCKGVHICKS